MKIIGRKEDAEREKRAEKLISLLNKNLGARFISYSDFSPGHITVRTRNYEGSLPAFHVYLGENRISVYSSVYLDDVLKLVEIYENSGEGEFIVKRNYCD